jgi:hypothetical protein
MLDAVEGKVGLTRKSDGLPKAARDDPFGPPGVAVEAWCLHCNGRFDSDEMVWVVDGDGDGFWSCPLGKCDGAGFGVDVHAADSEFSKGVRAQNAGV